MIGLMLTFVSLFLSVAQSEWFTWTHHSCLNQVIITWWKSTNVQIFEWMLLLIFLPKSLQKKKKRKRKCSKNSIDNIVLNKMDWIFHLLWKYLKIFEWMKDKVSLDISLDSFPSFVYFFYYLVMGFTETRKVG